MAVPPAALPVGAVLAVPPAVLPVVRAVLAAHPAAHPVGAVLAVHPAAILQLAALPVAILLPEALEVPRWAVRQGAKHPKAKHLCSSA